MKLNTKLVLTIAAASIAFASSAFAYEEVIGEVISTQQAPLKCDERRDNLSGNSVFTAIVGGVIGNQFGDGSGRVAATAVGAIVGAGIGSANADNNRNRMDCQSDGYISVIQFNDQYGNTLQTSRQTNYPLTVGSRVLITQ